MKYIDRLLQGAPVEWTTLEDTRFVELANRARRPVKASERIPGSIPYYGANNIQDYVDGYTHSGTYILLAEDGSASIDNYSIQWATGLFWANNHVHVLKVQGQLNSRFLYHYLKIVNYAPFLLGGERAKLTQKNLLRIPIPIPPVAVQEEVVRILDKFTALEAELEAELDCRKRQYQYYRDALLTFDLSPSDGLCHSPLFSAPFAVEWLPLGEVAEYSQSRIENSELSEESFIGVDNLLPDRKGKTVSNYVPTKGLSTRYQVGDVLIGNIRPYLKKIYLAVNNGGASGDVLVVHVTSDIISPKYLYQVLANDSFFSYNMRHAKGAKMPRGSKDKIMSYPIPIPPLAVQERIVEILDKFDTLVNSISEGLPREIELRRKQYEYYRDALLSF